jgi:hypothetical protein
METSLATLIKIIMTTKNLVLVKFEHKLYYAQLDGILVMDADKLQKILEEEPEVYLGECSGKHSEVIIKLSSKNLTAMTDDTLFISKLQSVFNMPSASFNEECTIIGTDPTENLYENGFFDEEEDVVADE